METENTMVQDFISAILTPSWMRLLLLINAFAGLYIFEVAWKNVERHRKPIKELDDMFP